MPAIIDSAPACVTHVSGAKPADDSADFIIQAAYVKCKGFMTFGPGSTYGEDGSGAETVYMILTWLGIAVTLAVLAAWVIYENRQLIRHVGRFGAPRPAAEGPPPQPGGVGDEL